MAAQHPPHRRRLVRRRRFQDEQGAPVTHLWVNIPLLPLHMRTWRSPDRRVGDIQFSGSPVGCALIFEGVLLVVLAVGVSHDVMTGQWMSRIPWYLVIAVCLCVGNLLWWRNSHQP
jgi:hypothetical protein